MLFDLTKLKNELSEIIADFESAIRDIRTGKVNTKSIENVDVEAYGTTSKLNALAQVLPEDAMNVKVMVWDKGVLPNVEQALRESSLGGSVAIDKDMIRLKFLPMTKEDREEKAKELNSVTENYRVRVRQVRQEYMKKVQNQEGVSEDEQETDQKTIQKEVDSAIEKIDNKSTEKEKEILSV